MTKPLVVSVPEDVAARVRAAAQRVGLTPDVWVCLAIEAYMDSPSVPVTDDPVAVLRGLQAPTGDIEEMLAQIGQGRS